MTQRKQYKPAYDDTQQEALERATKESTYTTVMDAWREFYTKGLINDKEREMAKKLLTNKLCKPCNEESTYEDELRRMNDLAKALKGNLDKLMKYVLLFNDY